MIDKKPVSFFVTGIDTGVGKTYTVAQLLRLLRESGTRCAGLKPICCGDRHDAELLLAAGSDGLTMEQINPIWLKTPAAPLTAAQVEQVQINPGQILAAFTQLQSRVDVVLVEGVGGWLVPIHSNYFVADLAAEMKLPVLVVAQNRLGCLNHTILTVRSVQDYGLNCAGVVLNDPGAPNTVATQTNEEILRQTINVPILPGLTQKDSDFPRSWLTLFSEVCKGENVRELDTSVNKIDIKSG